MIGQNTINISPIELKKKGFSIRSGIVTQLDRKGADGDFLQLGPWRSEKHLQVVLRQGRQTSNVFGGKAHGNVPKGTFSTGCKSNCVRIGLPKGYLSHYEF